MYVIDINTHFGCRSEYHYDLGLPALLRSLDEHAIAGAVTYSLKGVHYDPGAGNSDTIAAAAAHPHLIPAATLDMRVYLGWEQELERCLKAGVRVFRFFPLIQAWEVDSILFRRVLERLRQERVVLIFSTTEAGAHWGHAEEVARITAEYGLPVILTDTNYFNMAELISVLQAYPHVYAEVSQLALPHAVETMVAEVGSSRLLYGSDAPWRPMQKALNEVLEPDLSPEDKQAILGENALRLLGVRPMALTGRPELPSDQPRRFEEPSIDVHSHLGYWRYPVPDEGYDPTAMLARMDRYGIQYSILSSYESMRFDLAAGNRDVARAIEGHPRLLGYVEVSPHRIEESCQEMDRYYKLPNFAGAEIELSHTNHPTASEETRRLVHEVAKRGRPVLFKGRGDAYAERELARANPELAIIHAHSMDAHWARVVADTPNIYVEFCTSRPSVHDLRDCLKILGPERLLFGTDQTLLSVGGQVGLYLDANLTPEERRLILCENARRIFRLP
ncbi:MAG: amidohydrolase family protein [Anaerolineae bacterium]